MHPIPRHPYSDAMEMHDTKGAASSHAPDVEEGTFAYGEIESVQQHGQMKRGLKSRHVQFIALGGTIGTGLFLGIGSRLATAGPLSVLLGYTITGIAIFCMMQCLGEMATWLPLPGAIPQFAARYIDDAAGFAVGWNNWYNAAITQCAEMAAAAVLIGYWNDEINSSAWIAILIVTIVLLNSFAVSIYGEAEFVFASLKIVTIIGLIIMAFILDLGGGPNHDRLGFRYWKDPGAMREYIGTGDTGRFAGFFYTLVGAAFSYGGVEMVAVAAGEAENPRKNIPKAVKRVFWRILFFYVLGALAVGVMVPYNDSSLVNGSGAAASPWVIAIKRAGIKGLDSVVNAVILTSATSSANANLYVGSRYLYALAQNKQAPSIFLTCTKRGIPIYCVALTASITLLTFMAASTNAATVFNWLANLSTLASLLTWVTILIAYLRFHAGLKAQGVDRKTLPFMAKLQPYGAWFALIYFVVVILGSGFSVFASGRWNTSDFIVAYIGIPIYAALFLAWKLLKRTSFVRSSGMDIWSGKAEIDAQEEGCVEPSPRNVSEKIWFWLV